MIEDHLAKLGRNIDRTYIETQDTDKQIGSKGINLTTAITETAPKTSEEKLGRHAVHAWNVSNTVESLDTRIDTRV